MLVMFGERAQNCHNTTPHSGNMEAMELVLDTM